MYVFRLLIVCALILTSASLLSQDSPLYKHRVDSIRQIVVAGQNDSQMVEALNTLSMLAWRKGRYESSDSLAGRARELAVQLGVASGEAKAYNNLGTVAWYKGNYEDALRFYLSALKIWERTGNKAGLSDANNNVGMVHYYLGNYDRTIEYYTRSLRIDEELGSLSGVALSHNNIAGVYEELGNEELAGGNLAQASAYYDKAMQAYEQSQAISEKLGDLGNLALCYSNLGNIFSQKALLDERLNGKKADTYNRRALEFHGRSLGLKEELGDQFGISGTYILLGQVNLNMRESHKAIQNFSKGLEMSFSLGAKERRKSAYAGLSSAYEQIGDHERAYHYGSLYSAVRDSIYNAGLSEQIAAMEARYETEKKERQIALMHKERQIRAANIDRQRIITGSAVLLLVVVTVSSAYAFNRFRVARRQKRIIEGQKLQVERAYTQLHERNAEVLDSIYYARRIQRALITPEKYILKVLGKRQGVRG